MSILVNIALKHYVCVINVRITIIHRYHGTYYPRKDNKKW